MILAGLLPAKNLCNLFGLAMGVNYAKDKFRSYAYINS